MRIQAFLDNPLHKTSLHAAHTECRWTFGKFMPPVVHTLFLSWDSANSQKTKIKDTTRATQTKFQHKND